MSDDTKDDRYWSEYHETSVEELVKMFAESMDDIGRQDRVGLRYWLDSRTQSVVIRIDLFKEDSARITRTPHTETERRDMDATTELDWTAVKARFDAVRKQYQDLEGMPGVNTTLALRITFDPLARRYDSGERTRDLYDEMMSVE